MTANETSIENLLRRWKAGDEAALERLLPLVYADLRRTAAALLRAHPGHATLQTTALVHEMMLHLLGRNHAEFDSAEHLFNAATVMMRRVLIDRARAAAREKRGGLWQRDDFAAALELPIPDGTDLVALDAALTDLEALDERMAKVVQLRYFAGLDTDEVAAALGITVRTAHRDWTAARVWLKQRLDA
ncbi:MAG: ECF-type sigma factor [Rudaea sp.]|uniref:ECF-type sigma factor n=1 Tax=Rudaea sp. TaxID=2136325 RepID=UPI0039E62168